MADSKTHSTEMDILRQQAEKMVSKEEESAQEPLSSEQMQQMLHELRVHQVEQEMQNEELRRTQYKLETSRERYFELYDLAPIGYLTLDEQGLILEANLTAGTLLGMPRNALLKQPLTRFFHPEDQDIYYLQRKHLCDSNKTLTWDMRIINSAGSTFWAHLQAIPAQNGECRIVLEDITSRKHNESIMAAILRISEYADTHSMNELLTKVLDEAETLTGSTIGFFHFLKPDQETLTLQTWSTNTLKSMCTAEGKGQHYSIDKAGVWVECIHFGRPIIHNNYASLQNRKGLPQGHAPVVRELVVPVYRDNLIVSIIGVGNKPTDYLEQDIETVSRLINFTWDTVVRKQAEELLQKSEKQYRTILHTLLDGFWIVDMQGHFIDVNEAYCRIIGYTRNELLEMAIQDVEALETKADIEDRIQQIIINGSHRFESQHRCKDGHIVDLDICVSNLSAHARLCASLRDITERKRAEDSLRKAHNKLEVRVAERTSELAHAVDQIRESEERHQLATSVAKEAIWEVDFSTGTTLWNRAYTEIFNRPPNEHHHGEWWLNQIHPDDRERVNNWFSRAVAEGPDEWTDAYRMKRANGSYAYIQDRAIIVRDEAGKAIRAVGAKQDITERVEAEEALTRSEDRLHFALETSRTGAWDLDLDDHTVIRSLEHDRIFGYLELLPEWTYEKFLEHVLPEDHATVDGTFQLAMENRSDLNIECRIRRTDGQVRRIYAAGRHRKDTTGAPRRMTGIIQDITERKLVEEEIITLNTDLEKRVAERTAALAIANEQLRLANEEWVATFNASTDPIMILDRDCRIRRANRAMAAMIGLRIEECVGKFCYEHMHHSEAPIPSCPHNDMLQDGRSHTAEIFEEHIGKHLLVTVSPLLDANGSLTGSMHYVKDISTLKEAEQVLANAKRNLERKVTERTAELAEAHEKMKKVSFELIWAEEKERERIAAGLHDQVGQSLLLAKMKLDALEDELSDDPLHAYAMDAAFLIDTSIQDIRSLTFRMRPPLLDTAGIGTALEWLCSSISHDYNLQVDFTDDCHPKQLSAEMRYSLYQAVRELLLNVVKHAGTETAQLSITTENQTLVVNVADTGVGFNHPDAIMKHVNNGGYGLYNVRQRIEQMGGQFAVESTPGKGTSVTLQVPFY